MILVISSLGCLNQNDKNNIKNGTKNELELIISIESSEYLKNDISINVTFKLRNIKESQICVEKRFDLGSNLKIDLKSPHNHTLKVNVESSDHIIEKEILNPKEEKEVIINLKDLTIINNSFTYNWEEIGEYEISGIYSSLSNDKIYSPIERFRIL